MGTKLHVPKQISGGISLMAALSAEKAKVLISVLEAPPEKSAHNFIAKMLSEKTGIPADEAGIIILSLYGILQAQSHFPELSRDDFVKQVVKEAGETEGISVEKEAVSGVEELIKKALEYEDALGLSVRPRELRYEQQHLLIEGRILTDLRPIFRPSDPETLVGGFVIHTLRLSYQEQRGTREFYVALDRNDLLNLGEAIERAVKKEETIHRYLKSTNIRMLDEENE